MLKKSKRIISFFVTLAIILPMLFCSEYRVFAGETINSVVLQTAVSKPEAGKELYYAELYSINGSADKKLLADEDRTYIRWYRSESASENINDYTVFDETVFESGKYYDLYIKLYASEKAVFSKDCTLTLKTPEGTYEGRLYSADDSGLYIAFDLFFHVPNKLEITKQPVSASASAGEYVTVTTEAKGDGVTYQWWIKNPGDTVYTKSSVTSGTYKTNMTKSKDGRILRCVIKDKYGNMVKTDIVTITMRNPLVITKQPVSASASEGKYVTVTAEASGDGVTYQWWIKNSGDTVYTKSSITSKTYTTNMTKSKSGRILRCVIKDKYGNMVKTDIVTITMRNSLVITKQPVSASASEGKYVTVTAEASGDGVTYQWWIKNPSDTVYTKSSITSKTYTTNMTKSKSGRILRCVIKDKYGNTVKTNIVTITMK